MTWSDLLLIAEAKRTINYLNSCKGVNNIFLDKIIALNNESKETKKNQYIFELFLAFCLGFTACLVVWIFNK